MQFPRRAVIDVGTNSVKLLVAEVDGRDIRPVREQSRQTRLGKGFYETRRLQSAAIETTAEAVAAFADIARSEGAHPIRVFATSAAREALNRAELTAAIEHASGLTAEVISGEQEAEWGFQGVTSDPELAQRPLLLLDVGGGSAQFVFGRDGRLEFRQSFPMGTVRLLETLQPGEPPKPEDLNACREWIREFLKREVAPKVGEAIGSAGREGGESKSLVTGVLSKPPAVQEVGRAVPSAPRPAAKSPIFRGSSDGRGALGTARPTPNGLGQHALTSAATEEGGGIQFVGVGGTATILGCMEAELKAFDRQRIEKTLLNADRVSWHLERLWGLPLEQRKQIIGLPANRADVILMGVAIYDAVMQAFKFPSLRISTRGLRFAALMDNSQ